MKGPLQKGGRSNFTKCWQTVGNCIITPYKHIVNSDLLVGKQEKYCALLQLVRTK